MPDRQHPCRDPRTEARVPGARGPQRSDLSSGGGQVRQSNRSGLSKKPGAGDSSRQDDGRHQDDPTQNRNDGHEKGRGAGSDQKSERKPGATHGDSAQGDGAQT